jgi:hypothetical protein
MMAENVPDYALVAASLQGKRNLAPILWRRARCFVRRRTK